MILFYLNLLLPGAIYTQQEVDMLYIKNEAAVIQVMSNPQQTQGVIEWWQESPMIPTKR